MKGFLMTAILAALLLLAPTLFQSTQFKASIEGVVIDRDSGSPMGGVRVYFTNAVAWEREPLSVTTDSAGQFVIDVRATGRYRLLPERGGYVYSRPARLKTPRLGAVVEVSQPGPTPRVELPMVREGIIVGQILDRATGQPVPSIEVNFAIPMFDRYGNIYASRDLQQSGRPNAEIRTNDLGEYRIFGLPQGEYYVVYLHSFDRAAPIGGLSMGYHPGTDRLASASLIQVEAGKETRATPIVLEPRNRAAVEVRFRYGGIVPSLSPSDSPSLIFAADSWETGIRVAGQNNEASIRLTPGHYDVMFQILSTKRELFYSRMSFDVGTQKVEKEVTLTRAVNVTGSVILVDAAGKQIDSGGIRCYLDAPVQAVDIIGRSGCIQVQASTGNYQLRLSNLPVDAFVVSAKSGERDVLREGIEVAKDVHLDVEVATPGAVISGVVTDDQNNRISDATVVLVPEAPYRDAILLYRSDISVFDGTFGLRGVAPGTYRVFAWTDLPGPAYRNPEFLKKYEARGTPLKIENAATVSVNLIALD
jgi:5-hydroxyisourate hydrolase-like protein (transthyretin family)